MKKKIILVVVAILVIIQFIPALPDDYEPNVGQTFTEVNEVPIKVEAILTSACYDCHSHQSKWPWYSYVAPFSFWIGDHVQEGRKHLDFSQWANYSPKKADHKLEEIVEELTEGEMPLDSYTWVHSEAQLSESQKTLLVDYVNSLRN